MIGSRTMPGCHIALPASRVVCPTSLMPKPVLPTTTVVWVHPQAPAKPAEGAPCNGCGVCCLWAPCPLGMVVSRRRTGPCVALRWSDSHQRYQCAMVADPDSVTGWRNPWVLGVLASLARRWIAAGTGCDAHLQVQALPETARHDSSH